MQDLLRLAGNVVRDRANNNSPEERAWAVVVVNHFADGRGRSWGRIGEDGTFLVCNGQ